MIAASKLQEPLWVNNLSLLQDKIASILENVVEPDLLKEILDENDWRLAFTHKSADPKENNSTFAVYGMETIKFVFLQYLREKFGNRLDADKLTLLQNKYINNKSFADLAEDLELIEYVRYDPNRCRSDEDMIIRAFFGCLYNMFNGNDGYTYCYDLIEFLFSDITDVIEKDAKSQLKEIYEKMGWGTPQYIMNKSKNQCIIKSKIGKVVGIGSGSRKIDAEIAASKNALDRLTKKGITLETVEEYKAKRNQLQNQECQKQYARVEEAIQRHNQQGDKKITEFEIINLGNPKEPARYTFGIKAAYNGEKSQKIIFKSTSTKPFKAKNQAMKEFADLYNVDI